MDENQNKFDEFMKEKRSEYDSFMEKHKCCPKCGSEIYGTTLMAYVLDSSKKEEYNDKNICYCLSCGNTHIHHDRVSEKKFKSFKDDYDEL